MELTEVIGSRRSVHSYADEPLSEETIETIFESVRQTPSSYNLQPWEFLVLTEEANQEALQEAAFGQEHVTDAAAVVVVLGNLDPAAHAERVFDDWLESGYLPDEEARDGLLEDVRSWRDQPREENRIWTTRSTALAATNLMNAAWDEGVASCPMGGFDPDAVREAFDISDGYEPVMLVTLGYPVDEDELEGPEKFRRSVDEIVHYDAFDPVAPGLESEPGIEAPADDD
ncbi:nitroreductase family protein [Natronomonas sp. EA1]|uniref:nitroreductase family protein n=1 Tax=Natronomonas sp. EA1 TaxID=3421655 RepID=UPI003EBDDC5F